MSLPGFGILSSNMKTSRVWEICQTEAPIFAVFADHPKNSVEFQLVVKSSWLTASLQTLALELCFQFVLHFQRQVPLYFSTLGFRLQHFDSLSEKFLDKTSVTNRACDVDCQKRFPVSQTNSMHQVACFGRGST